MNEKRELIFDFDGVVGDTYQLNWSLVQKFHPETLEHGYRYDHHLGNVFETPVVRFNAQSTVQYYRDYNDLLSVSHIKAALPALRELSRDFRFHVVSSNCETAIERVLSEAGLRGHFGDILGYAAHASKVEKFCRLASTYGFTLPEALFVTDTLGDLKEAARVALPAVGVTFGYHTRALLEKGGAFAIVDNWDELVAAARLPIRRHVPAT
jgi:phosphoglycolate phosphatase-like HAD superfamily hydrolase